MKRILLSLIILSATGALALGVSRAFFSDEEKSTGNTFTAGAIDLKVDNTSYLNSGVGGVMVSVPGLTWTATDLVNQLFFNFADVKPGDLGEDTVSLKVLNNPAWVCADIDITANDDVTCTEPELVDDASCDPNGTKNGELADQLNFIFWADDGDNVLEEGERPLGQGSAKDVLSGVTWALADSHNNIWGTTGPMEPNITNYIGKAWCFGALASKPVPQNLENSPLIDPGVTCDGKLVNNAAQTDKLMGDIVFRAVQARHNEKFLCNPPKPIRVDRTQEGFGDGGWAGWSCPADTTAIGGGIDSSTNPVGGHGVAAPGAPAVDGFNYPTYPHYTYSVGETGYVVHDLPGDGLGNTISFHVDCLPN